MAGVFLWIEFAALGPQDRGGMLIKQKKSSKNINDLLNIGRY